MYSRCKTVAKFVESFHALNRGAPIADILITSVRHEEYCSRSFNAKIRKFISHVLRHMFPRGLSIVTRSDKDRLHCHMAVQLDTPMPDFDWVSFEESERYYSLYKASKDRRHLNFYRYYTRKYMNSLPAIYRKMTLRLMAGAKRYGLGHCRMVPVRKNMDAYKWYLVKNIPKRRHRRDKGLQYLSSWGLPTTKDFQVLNKYTIDYRRRLKLFSMGLQLTPENYSMMLRNAIGVRWFCRCKDLIRDIDNLAPHQVSSYESIRTALDMCRPQT